MEVPLAEALRVSRDIMGRSAIESCKHAIILMAQSAKNLAFKSKKNRRIQRNQQGQYVDIFLQRQHNRCFSFYKWQASDQGGTKPITWEQAKRIRNQGLAKRSWMWGLKDLNGSSESKSIPGVAELQTIKETNRVGYILRNKLAYIFKAMPGGWEQTVAARAVARIMKTAEAKMARKWKAAMQSIRKAA